MNSYSTRISYPFSKGTFAYSENAGINIHDYVITYNGTCDKLHCMKDVLEDVLTNHPKKLHEIRMKLKEYAQLVTMKLDMSSSTESSSSDSDSSYYYPDAFIAILVSIRHFIWHLLGRVPKHV